MIKKILLPLLAAALITACNNEAKEADHSAHDTAKKEALTPLDSLDMEVNNVHDEVMPKMGRVRGAGQRAQAALDSLAKLPAKAQAAATGLKTALEQLINDLNTADYDMNKWMMEYKLDSAKDNPELRMKYLQAEKVKVEKVKNAILGGLARADSLLKK